jgi:hypothetical protein
MFTEGKNDAGPNSNGVRGEVHGQRDRHGMPGVVVDASTRPVAGGCVARRRRAVAGSSYTAGLHTFGFVMSGRAVERRRHA